MKFLHTMIRVGDLETSKSFYTEKLGMKASREKDYPGDKFTLLYLVFPGDEDGHELELTYNYGTDNYELGSGYGHMAIGVDDINGFCDGLKAKGVEITYGPAAMGSSIIAFVKDPDGYPIEFIQRKAK